MILDKRTLLKKLRIGGVIFMLLIITIKLLSGAYDYNINYSYRNLLPQILVNQVIQFKQNIIQKLNFVLPEPQLSVVKSLLFGGKNILSYDLKILFRNTGLSHLIAISGLHLTIITQLFLYLINNIPCPKLIRFILLFCIILLYIIIADFSPSILRAASMALLMMFANLAYRQYHSSFALIITVLFLTAINPGIIKDISFQLSVLATFGIIYLYPILNKEFIFNNDLDNTNKIIQIFKSFIIILTNSFKLCLSALLFVLPLTIYYFHELSLITPLTNVLVVPLVPLVLILSFLVVFLLFLCRPVALFVSWLLKLLLDYFLFVIKFFGSWSRANFFISNIPLWLVISYYVILFSLLYFYKKFNYLNINQNYV